MAEIINMPRLSDTMTEGVVSTWLKKVGDKIEEGDILAEIETDKATMEFESFNEGFLLYIGLQEGESALVDSLLAIIGEEGEDISELLKGASAIEETVIESTSVVEEKETVTETTTSEIPEGIVVITMPRLSDTMTEGTVSTWLKKVGDKIEEGDILAEIETDKATMEFESFNEGTLLYIGLQEGDSAVVDSLLAIIGDEGVNIDAVIANFKSESEQPKTEVKEAPKAVSEKIETVAATPQTNTNNNSDGRIIASPLARKLAEEKGINLASVNGSGDHGRIIKRDVVNYVPTSSSSTASVQKFVASGQEDFDEIKHSQMRKVIAKRLGESKFTAPHYYLAVEFDMENAIAFRQQFNSIPDTKISYNDMIVKACALALKQHPQVNSQWFDDRMKLNNHVHIGVAVAVEDGLVVPVVKFANEQTLPQIGASVKDFAGRARNKKLTPAEMDGSTFTISNLGMFGIESFTSIINQPNSAILSVGNIVEKPVVKNGQIVIGNTMKLTLACDHRTVDGATGSLFLQTLKGFIENPVTMVV
jgi:pyruvate dehydrogenase E2 component (dihydrolipoamide acetyltransferase)